MEEMFEIGAFEIQMIADDLISNVEEPRSKTGHAFRHSVYKKWAGEMIVRFIFDQLDDGSSDIVLLNDIIYLVEQFRDHMAVYQTYNPKMREIFSAALSMSEEFLEVLNCMK